MAQVTWRQTEAARRMLASERGVVVRDWGGQVPIILAYPNAYAVGMSSLAIHGLYRWFNALPGVVCERAFAWLSSKERNAPPVTLESQRPLAEAAMVAFSVSYELDYPHIVTMLRRAEIPLRSEERAEGDPLILLGGPAVSANPEPLALLADAIVLGEAEELVAPLAECVRASWNKPRHALLGELARLPGVYVPLLHQGEPIERQWVHDLDRYPLSSSIVAPRAEFGDMHLIEISRGCGRGCRFCLAGFWYRPPRERSLEVVLQAAREGLRWRRKVGLVAAAVSDYSHIDELVLALQDMGAELSVSSLRMAPLSTTLVRALAQSGSRSITFAPEAGSERLRRVINKGLSHDEIIAAVSLAARYDFETLKLYFMFGLPDETDEDLAALIALAREIAGIFPRKVVVNLTPFVPKAHTPFQCEAMSSTELLEHRLAVVRAGLQAAHIELRFEPVAAARLQGVLARGDRQVGQALLALQHPAPNQLAIALERLGVDAERYLAPPDDWPLPWAFIDSRVRAAHLRDERERARAELHTAPCVVGTCDRCGACGADRGTLP